ncbi:unnamed protein product [Pseudo-nitzschia multistriata]|uniref:RNA polymerase I-specific transcription initiation factor RRN3 n=1 Tax=Pseudo-nitzschia multistriata TaxID=183589 RepID=A0A448YZE2_9STRA|nr:unnamed protein product [Pseudo-nitzschia multistriata]
MQNDSNDDVGGRARQALTSAETSKERLEELYKIPKCKLPPASEMAAIETFVVNAIQSQEPRNADTNNKLDPTHSEAYRAILTALKRPNDPPMICKVLLALRTAGHGSILSLLALRDNHAQLLHLVIRFVSTLPPTFDETLTGDPGAMLQVYKDYSLCDAHFNLLLAIVSAKSTHVVPVLTAVWKLLTNFGPIEDKGVIHRIHSMIFNVLRLVPKSMSDVYPIIASKFPFWLKDKESLVWYTKQSFKVLDYLPSIRQRVFELLIEKCVEIDVNIFIKDNGDVTIDETEQRSAEDEDEYGQKNTNKSKVNLNTSVDVLSDKLDALLELLFDNIQSGCQAGVSSTQKIYHELVQIFESTILTTHKSKFVQFCIFLPCGLEAQIASNNEMIENIEQKSNESPITVSASNSKGVIEHEEEAILYREFASKLLQILVDPYRATTTRQSCACYLASFVSRAAFIGIDSVCESISALLTWAEAYIGSLGIYSVRAADARQQSEHHALFYTVCQAAFYIMSFRGNEAIEYYRNAVKYEAANADGTMNDDLGQDNDEPQYPDLECINLDGKRWTSLCGHALQPLRFCLESVRSEFLHMAHFYTLIDEEVLNKLVADAKRLSTGRVNKKAASSIKTAATLERRRQTGGVGGLGRGSNPLKSFFPFDPLLLRQSHGYIEPLYKYWEGPVEEEDVLVIDEIQRDGDPTFYMDDDESIEESDGENENSDDDDDDSDIDHSEALSDSEGYDRPSNLLTPDAYKIKLLQQKAWTETLKRPRSQSMENGSW